MWGWNRVGEGLLSSLIKVFFVLFLPPPPALLSETSIFPLLFLKLPSPPFFLFWENLSRDLFPYPPAGLIMAENDVDNELLDYEDDEVETAAGGDGAEAPAKKDVKGSYVSIHSSGFRDFLLKPELLRAIVDCGFEHPSEGKFSAGHRVLIRQFKDTRKRYVWFLRW
jgi:hypothetical protein